MELVFENKQVTSVSLEDDEEDVAQDAAGWTGIFQRPRARNQEEMEKAEFQRIVKGSPQCLSLVFRLISSIDKDRNGYITQTELDDILKECYPALQAFNIRQNYKAFTSSANRVLVDYRAFKASLLEENKVLSISDVYADRKSQVHGMHETFAAGFDVGSRTSKRPHSRAHSVQSSRSTRSARGHRD